VQEICSLNKLVSSLDEKNAWGNDTCFAESAAWDPLQRLQPFASQSRMGTIGQKWTSVKGCFRLGYPDQAVC
jgi:hypothetical protein